MRVRTVLVGLLALTALTFGLTSASAVEGIGIPAQIVDINPPVSSQTHPVIDYGATASPADDRQGTTEWRVVKNTGNCCENHTGSTPDGRIFDVGGSFVNYTDDRGITWKSVRPLNPLVNGEGSIAMAPNGDVLAIEWDPYSGDHLVAYKYNAVSRKWFTMENVFHQPFYDRPWITVVPGPFAIGLGADTVPYIAFVQGGFPLKDPLIVSTDGLTYTEASSFILDGLTDTPVSSWFPIEADASSDWIQPITRSPVIPLGAGRALGAGGWLLDPGTDATTRKWHQWRLPDGSVPPTFIQIDSAGRIHHVRNLSGGRLEYRISADGAQTWKSLIVSGLSLGGLSDFKVNEAVGIGAIATRVGNQDRVYKFDVSGDTARLIRNYRLGLGNTTSVVGVTTNLLAPRMDFQTISILPDGRVAASFLDSTTLSNPPGTGMLGRLTPVLAIELETTLPRYETSLAYTGDTTGDYHDPATLSARLLNEQTDVPLAGKQVEFRLEGSPEQSCSATTDGDGTASCTIVLEQASGSYAVAASFGGDDDLAGSSATTTFLVTPEETTVEYTGATVLANGGRAGLSAVLKEDGVVAIPGRTLTLTLGSGSSAQSCTEATGSSGAAGCTVSPVAQPNGPGAVSAVFGGDAFYEPASDTPPTLVYDFGPTGGAFVVGDGNAVVGSSVTFWGAQWPKLNTLSGSSAPSAFKGFATSPSRPACGTGWSGDQGINSPPPAPLPGYIGVIVTSSATQSNSTPPISGDTKAIAVVKTNTGYQPDPAFAGTGAVVEIVC